MKTLTDKSKRNIAASLGSDIPDRLTLFLDSGEGELTKQKPQREKARESLMLWRVRAADTSLTGVKIEGIRKLVSKLRSLDPDAELDRYNHQKGRALSTLYRDARSKRPVGYLFVNTPRPNTDELDNKLGISASATTQPTQSARRSPKPAHSSHVKVRMQNA